MVGYVAQVILYVYVVLVVSFDVPLPFGSWIKTRSEICEWTMAVLPFAFALVSIIALLDLRGKSTQFKILAVCGSIGLFGCTYLAFAFLGMAMAFR